MHFKTIAPVAALLLFSSLGNCSPLEERSSNSGCNADNCLRALRRFSEQAIPFCSAYISVPLITQVATTTTPTVTVTSYTTVTSPLVDKRTAAILNARGDGLVPDNIVFGVEWDGYAVKRRDVAIPSFVSEYPASRISSACSCISIMTATTTITSTAPTATATDTVTVIEDPRVKCDIAYKTSGNGSGNRIEQANASSHLECCQKCQEKQNCVASAYAFTSFGKICEHLVNTVRESGETTYMCPLALENYYFGKPNADGIVYAGPCGY